MTIATAFPLVLAVQGMSKPIEMELPEDASVEDILDRVREQTGRDDLVELAFEDEDEPLEDGERVLAALRKEFRLLHASTRQRITVALTYEGVRHERLFRPNATVRRVIRWAIEIFHLEGKPAEFQIKVGDRVLPPDMHVGQAAQGACALAGTLVHNIKPQG